MQTTYGHLTYCSNIHAGESWPEHFEKLQQYIPAIKKEVSPDKPFGLGLRLSDIASKTLYQPESLNKFKQWLEANDVYVFTMNGFPFGSFHHTAVKDLVHAPDWLSQERVDYTIRLAEILSQLLPDNMEGGISTNPFTYRHWHPEEDWDNVFKTATLHLLHVVDALIKIRKEKKILIHIDIEPEPDGLLDNGKEFLNWWDNYLLPIGIPYLQDKWQYSTAVSESVLKDHVQLCYDVCHFAISYEDHAGMINELERRGIKTGKIQISAALKGLFDKNNAGELTQAFKHFNEPVYLHQVVAKKKDGTLLKYRDLPQALENGLESDVVEWRAHFHVPIFIESYNVLQSTQADIKKVLQLQKEKAFTPYLEVETYTWEVLPQDMRLPMDQSISRELNWIINLSDHS